MTFKRALVGSLLLLLFWASPPLRESLTALEPVLPFSLFTCGLVGALLRWSARRRRRWCLVRRLRRVEARTGHALQGCGWALCIAIFTLPLLSHWSGRPPSGVSAFAALFGRIPWGDAAGHVEGGFRLLAEGEFGPYSERRPLNASWLAVRLALSGGRLDEALLVQAVLLGLAAYLLARVVGARFGLWSALATTGWLLGLARAHLPTADTEPLGETLAAFALAILLSISARRRLAIFALGLFVFDAALQARPGPQLMLPALIVLGVLRFRKQALRAAVVLTAVAVASSLMTRTLNAFYGSGQASFTTYPAYTLYGLAHGGNYRTAQRALAEEMNTHASEQEAARILYRRAFTRIKSDPGTLVSTLYQNGLKFFEKIPSNLGAIVNPRALLVPSVVRARPPETERRYNRLLGLPILILTFVLTIARLVRRREAYDADLWLAAAVGFFLSMPVVFGDAGFRALAVAYPLLAVALSLGFASRSRTAFSWRCGPDERRLVMNAAALCLVVLVTSLAGPAVARSFWRRPARRTLAGMQIGETLFVARETSPAVLVAHVKRRNLHVPTLEQGEFLRQLEVADLAQGDAAALRLRRLPFALLSVYDFVSQSQKTVIGPLVMLRASNGWLQLDVRPIAESSFVEVARIHTERPPAEPVREEHPATP